MQKLKVVSLFLLYSCGTGNSAIQKEVSSSSYSKTLVLQNLRENYPPYNLLKAQFILKGKVDGQELLYDGTLEIQKESFFAVFKDSVFRSPFFSLKIDNEQVTQIDHLQNKKQVIPISEYRWVVLFGRLFPFRFFYPILRGFPPEEVFAKDTVYEEKGKDQGVFSFKTDFFDARVVVENGLIRNLFYKNEIHGEIVAITFEGKVEKQNPQNYRYFPKRIYISRPKSTDYVHLEFSSVRVN